MVNLEKKNERIRKDLEVIGEADHWNYFISIYFTFQTVSTIGFGDEYIYSPERDGPMLFIKPIFLIVFTSVLIALFSHVFNKIQDRMDKKAIKKSRQSSLALQNMSQGVRKASKAVSSHKKLFGSSKPSEIQKRLEAIRNENFDGGTDFDAMYLRRAGKVNNNHVQPDSDRDLSVSVSNSATLSHGHT